MGADEYFECIRDINPITLSFMERSYVIDFCIAALKKKREELLYRVYITDCLKAIAENTAHYVGTTGLVKAGMTMQSRYADLVLDKQNTKGKAPQKEKTQTADEVVETIKNKLKKLGSKPSGKEN
jgi:hypothetical protein